MSNKRPQGLSNTAFAQLAKVTKQAVGQAVKSGKLIKIGGLINPIHPVNARYVKAKQAENEVKTMGQKANDTIQSESAKSTESKLTAPGVYLTPKEIADVSLKREQTKKLEIQNAIRVGELFDRDLFLAVMGELRQSVQSNFVDQARRKSNQWAAELGIPEKEMHIHNLIAGLVSEGISGFQTEMDSILNSDNFLERYAEDKNR